MALNLIASPDKRISQDVSFFSNANAGNSQLPYTFERKDFLVGGMTDVGGFAQLSVLNSVINDFVTGELMFFGANDGSFSFTANSVSFVPSGADTLVLTNAPFTANVSGYTNLLRRNNYKANIQIWFIDFSGLVIPITFKYSPKPDGTLFVDAGRILTEYQRENKLVSFNFLLRHFESYDDFQGVLNTAPEVQSIIAKRQLLSFFGANLWQYLLKENVAGVIGLQALVQNVTGRASFFLPSSLGDVSNILIAGTPVLLANMQPYANGLFFIETLAFDGTQTSFTTSQLFTAGALTAPSPTATFRNAPFFLTKFKNSFVWSEWKRTCSYLIDSRFNARTTFNDILINQTTLDINGGVIATTNTSFNNDLTPRIESVNLLEGVFTSGVHGLKLQARAGSSSDFLSEAIDFTLKEPCEKPIMLEFRNSLGAFEQHLFTLETIFNNDVTEGLTGEKSIEADIENVDRTEERIPLHTTQEAILTEENLLLDQVKALNEIKSSEEVRVWLNKGGTVFIGVVVNNLFSTEINNDHTTFDISVQIKFPNNFDFESAKRY